MAAGVGGLDSGVTDVLIALGDMPLISAEMVQNLVAAHLACVDHQRRITCQVVMASEETR